METDRFNFDTTNQRIADLIWPASALFLQEHIIQGQRRDQFTFDSTGTLALGRFAAAVESILTPRTQRWHMLGTNDPALDKLPSVAGYCEKLSDILFKARYSPRSGFTYATGEHYMGLGAFGNGCIFLEDDVGKDLRYRSLFVGEIWIGTDFAGRIDRVHRKFDMTARQAKQQFGDKLPDLIKNAADGHLSETKYEFLHCVKPRKDYDPTRRDFNGMPLASYYVVNQEVIEEGGYQTMPYLYSRFTTAPSETYGRGPASMVLPTLNMINEQAKTLLRAGQRAVDPPIMTVDDDALETFNLKSSAINRGFLGLDGTALAVPFNSGANLPLGLDFVQDSRQVINDAFFVTLFQILVQQPQMTATEALLRAQEKGELLGPSVGRQQTELLDIMIEREIDILSRVPGLFPRMPRELQESGGAISIKYTSPLDKLQRSSQATAMLRWLESVAPLAQIKPEVVNVVNATAFARELADIQGVPANVLLDEDQQAAMENAMAQQQQAAQLLAAAPVAGKAALDLAKAQQLANAQPSAVSLL